MSEVLVEAKGIGKRYRRGMLGGIRLPRLFGRRSRDGADDEFWALKNIDLELREGDSLGIIGPNGAGKSTLLKILSRVTAPTEGVLKVRGRVGALIEVGAGFHQELSGRDNIFINGAILGMSRKEIQRRFDEIVAFAELEDFIDTPVKKYSSGMYVRLGFAVAAHMDPDILLIDEVLAVGDGRFQKKCFEAMARFRAKGTPVVLVSHALNNIRRHCEKGLLLRSGQAVTYGSSEHVINVYQEQIAREAVGSLTSSIVVDDHKTWCNREIVIDSVRLLDCSGNECQEFDTGDVLRVMIGYRVSEPHPAMHAEVAVYGEGDLRISTNSTVVSGSPLPVIAPHGFVECVFPRLALTPGNYLIHALLLDENGKQWYDIWRGHTHPQLVLTVRQNAKSAWLTQWTGLVDMEAEWNSRHYCTTSDGNLNGPSATFTQKHDPSQPSSPETCGHA